MVYRCIVESRRQVRQWHKYQRLGVGASSPLGCFTLVITAYEVAVLLTNRVNSVSLFKKKTVEL